ncbi:MAG: CoA transferase, partial [Rhodospirillaceae bacterium]|nr:CoA transferase [Rhodospirillaceae bacterium]
MAGPLDGVRVIELTTMITGSLCGQMLADMGADSIKIEKIEGGDMFRAWRGGRYSAQFGAYNRNKRSMTLDLRSDEGREILLKLVETADVLVENFRP